MRENDAAEPITRILWIGYNTHHELVAKGVFIPGESWTYELALNFGKAFDKVGFVVPFGKADVSLALTPEIAYSERGRGFPRLAKPLRLLLELPAAIRFLHRAAAACNPQVIVACGPHIAALLALLAPQLWRVPKLCFVEAFWETLLPFQEAVPRPLRAVLPLWYRLVYRVFDGYVGGPSLDPGYYERRGMRRDRIHPWIQPIDLKALEAISPATAPPEVLSAPRPRIVSVGRLHPEKLSLDALETFLAFARSGSPGSLILVGDGPLRAELERRAAAAGLADRVRITGFVPLPKAYAAAKASDLYLATMQGSALREAMAAGLPIVAFDNETHRNMIAHEVTGIITANCDHAAAAATLRDLIDDPVRARRLGDAAAAEIRRSFAPEVVEPILIGPIRAVARRHGTKRV